MSTPVPMPVLRFYTCSKPIQDGLPIIFSLQNHVEHVAGICSGCQSPLQTDHFRGQVRQTLPRVAEIVAVGFCPACQLVTPYRLRIYDDLSVLTFQHGRWVRYPRMLNVMPLWIRVFTAPLALLRWILWRRR